MEFSHGIRYDISKYTPPEGVDLCTIEDCSKPIIAKGLCRNHYQRMRRHGDPHKGVGTEHGLPLGFIKEAIKTKNKINCIVFPYSLDADGYGQVWYKGTRRVAHRLALTLFSGSPTDSKLLALHRPLVCHNTSCVNPHHIYWGNYTQNALDKKLDGTTNEGEAHGMAKLTEKQVLEIRKDNRLLRVIANDYGVKIAVISKIIRGESWRSVLPEEEKPEPPSAKEVIIDALELCGAKYPKNYSDHIIDHLDRNGYETKLKDDKQDEFAKVLKDATSLGTGVCYVSHDGKVRHVSGDYFYTKPEPKPKSWEQYLDEDGDFYGDNFKIVQAKPRRNAHETKAVIAWLNHHLKETQ